MTEQEQQEVAQLKMAIGQLQQIIRQQERTVDMAIRDMRIAPLLNGIMYLFGMVVGAAIMRAIYGGF